MFLKCQDLFFIIKKILVRVWKAWCTAFHAATPVTNPYTNLNGRDVPIKHPAVGPSGVNYTIQFLIQ